MPVYRPYSGIGKLKAETIKAVDPWSSRLESPDDIGGVAPISYSLSEIGEDGSLVEYIRDSYTYVGSTHILHPGSFFEEEY